jgi:cytosine/adenosine deaminase-related metal-dependent hydrolase
MEAEHSYSGLGLIGDPIEPRPVTIIVRQGIITRIEEESRTSDRWIFPAFFNAHTHLGDTVAMDIPGPGNLEELVTPPNGLKHRILSSASSENLIRGMRASISAMIRSGITGFADFREGGIEGVSHLQKASEGLPCHPIILGREGGETSGNGAGISSVRDVSRYEEIAGHMKREGKLLAFHAGEKDNTDIDAALACDPDLLVHCTHAAAHQIRAIADAGIPVVVCPRSNFLLGVTSSVAHPPVREMLEAGVEVLIGTDNVMFVNPDVMQEISFCHTVYKIPSEELFRVSTSGFSPSGINHAIEVGNKANFNILNVSEGNLSFSHDPITSLVKRSPSGQICATIFYV